MCLYAICCQALYGILISSKTVMHWKESRGGLPAGSQKFVTMATRVSRVNSNEIIRYDFLKRVMDKSFCVIFGRVYYGRSCNTGGSSRVPNRQSISGLVKIGYV